jgi:hypothetical protein
MAFHLPRCATPRQDGGVVFLEGDGGIASIEPVTVGIRDRHMGNPVCTCHVSAPEPVPEGLGLGEEAFRLRRVVTDLGAELLEDFLLPA